MGCYRTQDVYNMDITFTEFTIIVDFVMSRLFAEAVIQPYLMMEMVVDAGFRKSPIIFTKLRSVTCLGGFLKHFLVMRAGWMYGCQCQSSGPPLWFRLNCHGILCRQSWSNRSSKAIGWIAMKCFSDMTHF